MSYVPAALRQQVIERAESICEYCLFPQSLSFLAFEMEHIIAEKQGGATTAENLALACPYCTVPKGQTLAHLTLKPANSLLSSIPERNGGQSISGWMAQRFCP